jgi:hypothetical protein
MPATAAVKTIATTASEPAGVAAVAWCGRSAGRAIETETVATKNACVRMTRGAIRK